MNGSLPHPMDSNSNPCFAEGIRLFNQGHFFEAHEVWEQIWKEAEGEERIFYQGIIQTAAALTHVQRGNYQGAVSVYLKSRPKLDRFPAVWMGIDLEQLRRQLSQYFHKLQTFYVHPGSFRRSTGRPTAIGCPPSIKSAPGEH
ncbi:MAG: DUF309 domain-containing protein [Deltaproteobacteria bacterium]|nr:DUF309 domain-containing protein [Deltaproteobacteria bacterium]